MMYSIKTYWKIILVLASLVLVYFIFMMTGGGFGKKPVEIRAMQAGSSPFLFAHRGIPAYYPENSRESIEAAKLAGFKGLETDLRKTSDNEFVLFHDENCSRLLGIDKNISDLTLDETRRYPIIFNNLPSSSKVVTLKEILDEYRDDFIFYFDLKLSGLKDIDDLVRIIKLYDITGSSMIASTNGFKIFYIECKYPEINTSLEGFNSGKEWIYCFFPKKYKPDFLASFAGKVDEKHMEWLNKRNLLSCKIVYDVDKDNYDRVLNLGLKNLIMDYDSTMLPYCRP